VGDAARFDADQLRVALGEADIRVLLAVLVHLTGERRWIEPPYLPQRDTRLIPDVSAGFPQDIQDEVRATVFDLLRDGPPAARIDEPDEALFLEMMSVSLGERVAPEYVPMMLQEMGFRERTAAPIRGSRNGQRLPSAVIIGAGISGIAAAVRLGQAGIPYIVLEKNEEVGGTWFENHYPDCGVDTPNHFYCYSFASEPGWTHYFSPRDEIEAYLVRCVNEFGVKPNVRFGVTVDRASWNEQTHEWVIEATTSDGPVEYRAPLLLSAVGQLNRPFIPDIPGLDGFDGECFHSARWPDGIDLHDRRVGVVGNGASAMQLVPPVAQEAASVTIFQRSKQWIRPIDEYRAEVSDGIRWLMEHVPYYLPWYRFNLAWRYGDGLHRTLQRDPSWPHPERSLNKANDRHRAEMTAYFERMLGDRPELLAKTLPDYPPFAKRMLVDNGWLAALRRPNVELVTEPIAKVLPDGIETEDGEHRPLDVLVLATGFHAKDLLGHLDVRGCGGRTLASQWGCDDARAYLGITVPGFPNLFLLYGPNTNLAHGGSIIFHAECQVRYIVSLIGQMVEEQVSSVEVRPEVHDAYNQRVDAAHQQMVWTHPGVDTWYRNSAGRVVSNSPWRLVDYWHMTHQASLDDYLRC
jgi:4-hydroxyacetophenone monooxygenase